MAAQDCDQLFSELSTRSCNYVRIARTSFRGFGKRTAGPLLGNKSSQPTGYRERYASAFRCNTTAAINLSAETPGRTDLRRDIAVVGLFGWHSQEIRRANNSEVARRSEERRVGE